MGILEMPQALSSIMTIIALLFGIVFGFQWLRRQQRREFGRSGSDFRADDEPGYSTPAKETDTIGPQNGGYILLDLPEAQKPLFHDLLKGFEEFAAIKGYSIQFSIDGSLRDRIAFKFTLMDSGIGVTNAQVKSDLQEYIRKVQQGESLDDLPVVLPEPEHQALLLSLKNRASFLEHTYAAQKNVIEFYERTMREVVRHKLPVLPAQNIYVQAGSDQLTENKFHTKQAGAVGPHAMATNFSQTRNEASETTDLVELASQLGELRSAMRAQASEFEHDVALGAIAAAEDAARQANGQRAFEYLQKAGAWALGVAKDIGDDVAATAIAKASGMA